MKKRFYIELYHTRDERLLYKGLVHVENIAMFIERCARKGLTIPIYYEWPENCHPKIIQLG
jgi:hypothetical protein